mmetsp:Transcript_38151/g.119772  ORF Transcript_38151/g.119772 Transcript_38151/m.119772 type:complete len:394 (-) Transcript_38151:276-1457(-)
MTRAHRRAVIVVRVRDGHEVIIAEDIYPPGLRCGGAPRLQGLRRHGQLRRRWQRERRSELEAGGQAKARRQPHSDAHEHLPALARVLVAHMVPAVHDVQCDAPVVNLFQQVRVKRDHCAAHAHIADLGLGVGRRRRRHRMPLGGHALPPQRRLRHLPELYDDGRLGVEAPEDRVLVRRTGARRGGPPVQEDRARLAFLGAAQVRHAVDRPRRTVGRRRRGYAHILYAQLDLRFRLIPGRFDALLQRCPFLLRGGRCCCRRRRRRCLFLLRGGRRCTRRLRRRPRRSLLRLGAQLLDERVEIRLPARLLLCGRRLLLCGSRLLHGFAARQRGGAPAVLEVGGDEHGTVTAALGVAAVALGGQPCGGAVRGEQQRPQAERLQELRRAAAAQDREA